MKAITYTQIKKALRIAAKVVLGAFAAACLYAVIFMHRHDHLFTTAAYAAIIWMVNRMEK